MSQSDDDFPSPHSLSESINVEAGVDDASGQGHPSIETRYDGIIWANLRGYIAVQDSAKGRSGWTWKHGYEVCKQSNKKLYWVCKICNQRKAHKMHIYVAKGTNNHAEHLSAHRIYRDGEPPQKKQLQNQRQINLLPGFGLDANKPRDQALLNHANTNFSVTRWQQYLLRWIVCDTMPFRTVDSQYFRDLMEYSNRALVQHSAIPTHPTIASNLLAMYQKHKGVVTELLLAAPGKIHISFDGWTSRNNLSLLGMFMTIEFYAEACCSASAIYMANIPCRCDCPLPRR